MIGPAGFMAAPKADNKQAELWECAKRKCKWIGTDAEKDQVPHKKMDKPTFRVMVHVCPKCGCDGFYPVGSKQ